MTLIQLYNTLVILSQYVIFTGIENAFNIEECHQGNDSVRDILGPSP